MYFSGLDFDAIMHAPVEESGMVFETKFPTPDNLGTLTEDGKPRVVVLDDWMNRILEDPGYVEVFTTLVHHRCLMLFVTQQVQCVRLLPLQVLDGTHVSLTVPVAFRAGG